MSSIWLSENGSNRYIQTYMKGFLDISGGDLIMRNHNIYVKSGDVSINGILMVADDVSLNSKLFVHDDVSMDSILMVADDVSFNSKLFVADDVSMNKNVDISGDLVVKGNLSVFQQEDTTIIQTTVNNYRIVDTLDISVNGNLVVSSDVSLNSKLFVKQDVSFNTKLSVGNDVSMNSKLEVANDVSFNSKLFVKQDVSFNTKLSVGNDVSLNSKLEVANDVSLNSKLFVNGDVSFNTKLSVGNDVSMNSKLEVTNDVSLNSKLFVNGDVSFNTRLSVGNDVSLNSKLFVAKDFVISGNILPTSNGTLNLGSLEKPFKSLYISDKTIYFKDIDNNNSTTMSIANNNIQIQRPDLKIQTTIVSIEDKTAFGKNSDIAGATIDVNGNAIISGDVSFNSKLSVGGDVSMNSNVDIIGNLVIDGNLQVYQKQDTMTINTTVNNYEILATKDISLNGNLVVSNVITANSKLNINKDQLYIQDSSVTTTATELNYLDGSTPGSATANNALVLDGNKDIVDINYLSTSSMNVTGEITANTIIGTLLGAATRYRVTNVDNSNNTHFLPLSNTHDDQTTSVVNISSNLSFIPSSKTLTVENIDVSNIVVGNIDASNITVDNELFVNKLLPKQQSDIIDISFTNSLIIPRGDSGQRNTIIEGALRYNTEINTFEGYSNDNWGSLGGVTSLNRNVYISATNENGLQFFTEDNDTSVQRMQILNNGDIIMPGTIKSNSAISATTFYSTSDYRIKDNVTPLNKTSLTIDQLNPVIYDNQITNNKDIGLIAHEVQEHFPYIVTGEKDGDVNQTVNYTGLVGILIHEIQQLKKRVSELEQKCN